MTRLHSAELAFPDETRTVGPELKHLARINLSGGNIRTIALNAAFLTAARKTEVTMPIAMEAVRVELKKLGRPAAEAELRLPRDRESGR